MPKIKNHYKTLGVATGASAREILKARNKLLRRHHPDLNQGREDEAKERTIDILMAAEVLLDEGSRAEYDRLYHLHFGAPARKPAGARREAGGGTGAASAGTAPAGRAYAGAGHTSNASSGGAYTDRTSARGAPNVVLCGHCNRSNVNPKRNYCMYCGFGIGDNPRPFSFDDVDTGIINEYFRAGRKRPSPEFRTFSKEGTGVFNGVIFCLFVLFQAFQLSGANSHLDLFIKVSFFAVLFLWMIFRRRK